MTQIENTGERILLEKETPMMIARHLSAYKFSGDYISGCSVLDVACGEGYGSAYLADFAKSVKAIDYSREAVDYANSKYKKDNLQFAVMDVRNLFRSLSEKFSAIWKDLKPGTVLNAEIGIYMTKPYIKECTIESVGTGNPLPEPEKPSESHPSEKYKADPAKLDTTMRDTALMQAVQYTSHNYTTTVAFSEIESSYDAFLAMLKGDKLARVESMKEVKDVSEPSKPASTTAVVAKVEADRMENRGTE